MFRFHLMSLFISVLILFSINFIFPFYFPDVDERYFKRLYASVQSDKPVFVSHIKKQKIKEKHNSQPEFLLWANAERRISTLDHPLVWFGFFV